MAVSSVHIPADARRDAKARELAKTAHTWNVHTLRKPHGSFKVGDQFLQTPKGYRCNAVVCECQDYARGNICKHIRAVVLLDQQARTARYEDIAPAECQAKSCTGDAERGEMFCPSHRLTDAF